MNHKKLNYLLGPIVAIVWFTAMLQLFNSCQGPGPATIAPQSELLTWVMPEDSSQGFKLKLNYADPFLKKAASAMLHPPKPLNSGLKIGKPSQNAPTRSLIYLGGVERSNDHIITGLLMLENDIHAVEEGDEIGQIRVLNLDLEQITLAEKDSVWKLNSK